MLATSTGTASETLPGGLRVTRETHAHLVMKHQQGTPPPQHHGVFYVVLQAVRLRYPERTDLLSGDSWPLDRQGRRGQTVYLHGNPTVSDAHGNTAPTPGSEGQNTFPTPGLELTTGKSGRSSMEVQAFSEAAKGDGVMFVAFGGAVDAAREARTKDDEAGTSTGGDASPTP